MCPSFRLAVPVVLSICVMLVGARTSMLQGPSTESQVKAAFLYNFAKFIEWPSQVFPRRDSGFTICLAGDPFEGALDKTVEGENLDNRPLVVRRIAPGEDMRGCQIVYVAPNTQRLAEIVNAAGAAPILTVGETEEFINNGGIIRFTETGHRVHFQINPDAAERVSLKVSSRLLRLADIVRPRTRLGVR